MQERIQKLPAVRVCGRRVINLPLAVGPKQICALPACLFMPPMYTKRVAPGHSGVKCLDGVCVTNDGQKFSPSSLLPLSGKKLWVHG